MNNVEVKPGISDHDLVFSEVFTKPIETRQPPRSAYLYRKADCGGFQTYMEKVKEEILASTTSKSVEELWILFKSSINEGLSKFVHCKKIGSKRSLPWITQEIKRLVRKRDSLYQMYKRSWRPKYRKEFVTTRHIVKTKIKQAYNRYLEDLLGVNNPDQNISPAGETGLSKFAPKKLFPFCRILARTRKVSVHFVTPIPKRSLHPIPTKQIWSMTIYNLFSLQYHLSD